MDVFKRRRLALLENTNTVALRTNSILYKNHDAEFPYRPDSNFYYLTGYAGPHAVALVTKKTFVLFVETNKELNELWTGKILSLNEVKKKYHATHVFDIATLEKVLPRLLKKEEVVCLNRVVNPVHDKISKFLRKALRGKRVKHVNSSIAKLRLRKDHEEIALLKKAVAITHNSFLHALRLLKPGTMEYEVEATLLEGYRKNNAIPGYNPIVASGKNALVLHYTENKDVLRKSNLLLIDSGAEFGMYTADVTRTVPISGRYSKAQKEIYELVLKANREAIRAVKPGVRLKDVHVAAVHVLADGLLKLGLLKGDQEKIIAEKQYRRFFMHGTSHWLGMDVHDCAGLKEEFLQEGCVLTVEPGLYIPDAKNIPQKFRGIGVRIEDDVLVTKNGCEVLTKKIPKGVREIERLLK